MKAIIVGGGIGGLNAALCFNHFGWDVEILEQAAQLEDIGAGIQISPNGMHVLRALDIDGQVAATGCCPRATQFRMGQSGRVIMTQDMGQRLEEKWGAPYLHIHRADLISAMADALSKRCSGALRMATPVAGYGQNDHKAWAILSDGSVVEGDIIVGADGIKSPIRTQMLGQEKPRFTGNVAWRAVVPVAKLGRNAPLPVASVWLGEGKHAVTYLLRGGKLANLVGVVERDDWQQESWTEKGTREQALADFAGWHPTITTLLEQADHHYRWALFDRDPLDQWIDGRAVLIGDAAHPMLPFMAQGAVQAIEDGYVLARLLAEHDDHETALTLFFQARRARTASVQEAARRNMNIFHQRTTSGKLSTYAPIWLAGKIPGQEAFDAQMEWLYGHDVTAN
ncbi:FAD-dependent monooxygenase [Parasphingorhabdus cellanae]|uniref:FAD-dependent monooxygenase n=1 Tax=Parasphingorhabdus cellanae TaxID=2806553 RepID=A0ABX7T064_9SPHN|nr:FAD-dependent monooxygenase [Parasphingorhabdus cellanae]QTD54925.1 FAD-dependent monooxygenase [Parasphingorhabdus cellanae]